MKSGCGDRRTEAASVEGVIRGYMRHRSDQRFAGAPCSVDSGPNTLHAGILTSGAHYDERSAGRLDSARPRPSRQLWPRRIFHHAHRSEWIVVGAYCSKRASAHIACQREHDTVKHARVWVRRSGRQTRATVLERALCAVADTAPHKFSWHAIAGMLCLSSGCTAPHQCILARNCWDAAPLSGAEVHAACGYGRACTSGVEQRGGACCMWLWGRLPKW